MMLTHPVLDYHVLVIKPVKRRNVETRILTRCVSGK